MSDKIAVRKAITFDLKACGTEEEDDYAPLSLMGLITTNMLAHEEAATQERQTLIVGFNPDGTPVPDKERIRRIDALETPLDYAEWCELRDMCEMYRHEDVYRTVKVGQDFLANERTPDDYYWDMLDRELQQEYPETQDELNRS